MNLPALLIASKLQQRHPVADGVEDQGRRLQPQSRRHRPLHPEVMDRGRPHGSGEESGLLEQGSSLSRPDRSEAVAGCAIALCQSCNRAKPISSGTTNTTRTISRRRRKIRRLSRAHLCGSGASGLRLQHQGRAVRRRAGAPGVGDGDRSQEDVAGDYQWPGPAGQQPLWRGLVGQVQGRRCASLRCRERPRR